MTRRTRRYMSNKRLIHKRPASVDKIAYIRTPHANDIMNVTNTIGKAISIHVGQTVGVWSGVIHIEGRVIGPSTISPTCTVRAGFKFE